jgi:hypothetical protein
MKNTFFIFVMALLVGFSAYAQKDAQKKKVNAVKQVNIPENVTNTFKSQYTVANDNQWNKNYSGNYVASFTNAENLKQSVEFSGSGAVVKSKIEYAPEAVPENISTSISAQYPNTKITEATKMQMPGVAPYYRIKIITAENTAKELLVSEEGTITE